MMSNRRFGKLNSSDEHLPLFFYFFYFLRINNSAGLIIQDSNDVSNHSFNLRSKFIFDQFILDIKILFKLSHRSTLYLETFMDSHLNIAANIFCAIETPWGSLGISRIGHQWEASMKENVTLAIPIAL